MNIGTLIKTIRTSRGISQKELAENLDISTNYLCLVETGNRNPSEDLISKIATYFEISKEALSFICTSTPKELDEKKSKKFKELQENIAALIFLRNNKVA